MAESWSGRYRRGGFARRRRYVEAEILGSARLSGAWLDAGCGAGDFTHVLADRGAVVRGMDASAAMIAAARDRAGAPRFEQGRVENLTEREAFDGVLCLSVLEYVDDPAEALARLSAALKPGGRLILSAPRRGALVRAAQSALRRLSGQRLFAYLASSRHVWSAAELAAMLRDHGLAIETLKRFDPILPRPLWSRASLWFATCRKAMP